MSFTASFSLIDLAHWLLFQGGNFLILWKGHSGGLHPSTGHATDSAKIFSWSSPRMGSEVFKFGGWRFVLPLYDHLFVAHGYLCGYLPIAFLFLSLFCFPANQFALDRGGALIFQNWLMEPTSATGHHPRCISNTAEELH